MPARLLTAGDGLLLVGAVVAVIVRTPLRRPVNPSMITTSASVG
ncbi:hypothetical protein AB0L59_03650 [Streptomyces sp. NPDC052109]